MWGEILHGKDKKIIALPKKGNVAWLLKDWIRGRMGKVGLVTIFNSEKGNIQLNCVFL